MTKAPRQQSHGFIIATFNQAMAAHRAGDLARAETLYKLVLARDERQFDAMHMLGIVAGQQGARNEDRTAGHRDRLVKLEPPPVCRKCRRGRGVRRRLSTVENEEFKVDLRAE